MVAKSVVYIDLACLWRDAQIISNSKAIGPIKAFTFTLGLLTQTLAQKLVGKDTRLSPETATESSK